MSNLTRYLIIIPYVGIRSDVKIRWNGFLCCINHPSMQGLPIIKITKDGTYLRLRVHHWTWDLTTTLLYLTWNFLYLISRFSEWTFIYSVAFLLDINQSSFWSIFYSFFIQRISPTLVFLASKWNIDAISGVAQSQLYSLLNRLRGLLGEYIFSTLQTPSHRRNVASLSLLQTSSIP